MTLTTSTPVLAAGAVCWRLVGGELQVLVVHRTQHRDVSLPKGKIEAGETLPETAVREIAEETGLRVTLGAQLGTVGYRLPNGREKLVYYWSAEATDEAVASARFRPNDEIAACKWLPTEKARKRMTYEHDVAILDRFVERFELGAGRTYPLILLRHGKAVPHESWDGPDSTRPLLQRGTLQAKSIAAGLAGFGIRSIVSSTAERCLQTVAPVSRLTRVAVKPTAAISQEAFEHGTADVESVVERRLSRARGAVLCSHGPVLPHLIDAITRATGTDVDAGLRRAAMLSTGEFAVLHVSIQHPESGLVAVETHTPAA